MNEGQRSSVPSVNARYVLVLPVPQLFIDLHRLTVRRVIDISVSQPDLGTSSPSLTLGQWEET